MTKNEINALSGDSVRWTKPVTQMVGCAATRKDAEMESPDRALVERVARAIVKEYYRQSWMDGTKLAEAAIAAMKGD